MARRMCDWVHFLRAVCGVRGVLARMRLCARSDVGALQCAVVVAVRDVLRRACGTCVLCAALSVRCAVRGLLACTVLVTRAPVLVPLWRVGLAAAASCV
jgi:hypothetical protein